MASNLPAVELLRMGDEGRVQPWLNRYWSQLLGVTFGIGTGVTINFCTRRPLFSGIQKHIVFTAIWTGGLMYFGQRRLEYFAEKDAILKHYIQLHPEDFPIPERKKIGDILEPWIPIR